MDEILRFRAHNPLMGPQISKISNFEGVWLFELKDTMFFMFKKLVYVKFLDVYYTSLTW
jgi:hypothetical protein